MNELVLDAEEVLTVLITVPVFIVWGFALYDIARRPDLGRPRKLIYAAAVVIVLPLSLLYLLSRPTSIVRHRDRRPDDWRDALLAQLEAGPGDPPPLGRREEELLIERISQSTGAGAT